MNAALLAIILAILAVFAAATSAARVGFSPSKPEWADVFIGPFGLNNEHYNYQNTTSSFLYNWKDYKAALIKYDANNCFPLFTGMAGKSCRVLQSPKGMHLFYGDGYQKCCTLFDDIGAIPPNFLAGFTYEKNTTAVDMYGVTHNVYEWTGQGFKYWTGINSGNDIAFQDGPPVPIVGKIWWSWGNFIYNTPPPSSFYLPSNCAGELKCWLDKSLGAPNAALLKRFRDQHIAMGARLK